MSSSRGKAKQASGKKPRAAVQRRSARKPVLPPAPEQRVTPPPVARRVGSPMSRLTIKAGPQQGPRVMLGLSTRKRAPGPRPLSEVPLDEDEVLIDGFEATLGGQRVRITAVLERTCVYVDPAGDRRLARKEELVVEADKLPIRRRGFG